MAEGSACTPIRNVRQADFVGGGGLDKDVRMVHAMSQAVVNRGYVGKLNIMLFLRI